MRVVFHERDDAEAVAARLRRDGFEASLARERFAGEDDDEDHAWAVVTDAPEVMVDLLAEEYDGWVDHDAGPHGLHHRGPLDLPDGPRRLNGQARE